MEAQSPQMRRLLWQDMLRQRRNGDDVAVQLETFKQDTLAASVPFRVPCLVCAAQARQVIRFAQDGYRTAERPACCKRCLTSEAQGHDSECEGPEPYDPTELVPDIDDSEDA